MEDPERADEADEAEAVTEQRGLEPDPLTFEGQMQALGRLTGGVGNAQPWQRWLLRAVVWFMLLTTIIGVVVIVIVAIQG